MNQKRTLEEDVETALLTDLPLSVGQAEEAKAGYGGVTLIGPPETAGVKKGESNLTYSGEPG